MKTKRIKNCKNSVRKFGSLELILYLEKELLSSPLFSTISQPLVLILKREYLKIIRSLLLVCILPAILQKKVKWFVVLHYFVYLCKQNIYQ